MSRPAVDIARWRWAVTAVSSVLGFVAVPVVTSIGGSVVAARRPAGESVSNVVQHGTEPVTVLERVGVVERLDGSRNRSECAIWPDRLNVLGVNRARCVQLHQEQVIPRNTITREARGSSNIPQSSIANVAGKKAAAASFNHCGARS